MSRSALQDYAEGVAAKCCGVDKTIVQTGVSVGAIEWVILIEMIMQIVMQFMEQCNQPKDTFLASVKRPTRLQKARFYNVVRSGFDDQRALGWRRQSRDFADTMLNDLPPDSEILNIVGEVRGGF